jgi:hypothetical protein
VATRDEEYAEKTKADRLKVHALVQQGKSEKDAMVQAMPGCKNRPRMLKQWKARGLWPVPPEEQDTSVVHQFTPVRHEDAERSDTQDTDTVVQMKRDVIHEEGQPHIGEETTPVVPGFTDVRQTTDASSQFTDDQVEQIMEMLTWWNEHKQEPVPRGARPDFKRSETVVKAVRIGREMFDAVNTRLQSDRANTGGSFSALVEMLLWEYLGRPESMVERGTTIVETPDA